MSHHEITQPDFGSGEKTLDVYVTGTIVCVILTILPFAAVMTRFLSDATTVGVVVTCMFAQFIVQLVCFLRMNYDTEQAKINVQTFAFTLFMLFVVIAGSLWIMASLSYNMMH